MKHLTLPHPISQVIRFIIFVVFIGVNSLLVYQQEEQKKIRYTNADYQFSVQPPFSWIKEDGKGATIVKFRRSKSELFPYISVIYARAATPISLSDYVARLEDFNKNRFKDYSVISREKFEISGIEALKIEADFQDQKGEKFHTAQTIIADGLITFYSLDVICKNKDYEGIRGLYNNFVSSFHIERPTLRDTQALKNTLTLIRGLGTCDRDIFEDSWYLLTMQDKKIGWCNYKIGEMNIDRVQGYVIESNLYLDGGEGGSFTSRGRGSVSCDFATQDYERTDIIITKEGKKLINKFSGKIRRDEAIITRDIQGIKSEIKVKITSGTFLPQIHNIFKKMAVTKGTTCKVGCNDCLIYYLSFEENFPQIEFVKVIGKDWSDEFNKNVIIAHSKTTRQQETTYWFDAEAKNLLKIKDNNSPIILIAASKDAALNYKNANEKKDK